MVFGGKKTSSMDLRLSIVGCAGQLSMINATFFFSFVNFVSISRIHSSKSTLSIQLLF